jgi:spore coat polysaccharide biosynthesis protein SpsF (cytidylyltransferase family)
VGQAFVQRDGNALLQSRRTRMDSATLQRKPALEVTKRAQLIALLERKEGASLDEMVVATGWLPHTTRAALTGLRKSGKIIESDKVDGVRRYRIVGLVQ